MLINKMYYYNKNADKHGYHEVHTVECTHGPLMKNCVLIGFFNSCREAIKKARKMNPMLKYDGCKHCCESCHKV